MIIKPEGKLHEVDCVKVMGEICEGLVKKCFDRDLTIEYNGSEYHMPAERFSEEEDEINDIWKFVGKYIQFVIDGNSISRIGAQSVVREVLRREFREGMHIEGIVKRITDASYMIDVGAGVLCELPFANLVNTESTEFCIEYQVEQHVCCIIKENSEKGMVLSVDSRNGEWQKKISKYTEGSFVLGTIIAQKSSGYLIELEENIVGMSNYTVRKNLGEIVSVFIKKIDIERKRIKLDIVTDEYRARKRTTSLKLPVSTKEKTRKDRDEYISPFATYSGEKREIENADQYISMGQIAFDMEHGYVDKSLYELLYVVNDFKYVTSKQIADILAIKGIEIDISSIKKILAYCARKNILTRSYFVADGYTKSSYRVYHMGRNGYNLLRQENVYVNFKISDLADTAERIKQNLAANQYAIYRMKQGCKIENISSNKIISIFSEKGIVARVNTIICDEEPEICVVVRRTENWEEELKEKIARIRTLITRHAETNFNFNKRPTLIICAEDEKHVCEIKNILNDINVKFVVDEKTNY